METAWDKVGKALLYTAFFLALVFCLSGHPPAHAQDGTSSANTVQGLYIKEALEEKDIAQNQAQENANSLALAAQDIRLRELENGFARTDTKMTIFGAFLTLMIGGNIIITWRKK